MEISNVKRELAGRAAEAAVAAYCPYSNFRVGAAVMTEDTRIFTGCNVENASYGLTICAERNAVFAAVAAGARRIVAVAVAGGTTPSAKGGHPSTGGELSTPVTPCGACRQVLAEFCDEHTPVICAGLDGVITLETTVGELLPNGFVL